MLSSLQKQTHIEHHTQQQQQTMMPNSVINKKTKPAKWQMMAVCGGSKTLTTNCQQIYIKNNNSNNMRTDRSSKNASAASIRQINLTSSFLILFMFSCLSSAILIRQVESSSSATAALVSSSYDSTANNQSPFSDTSSRLQYAFDATTHKSIHEAIRNHPDLREFAALCEADGVKEIISMDKTPLTVFAPIDKSLSDLLAKSKSRSINLIELTKHHIAQGFVMPDENTKYPLQFSTYSLLSPLYLNQARAQPASVFVNNAKIIATHLIPIDADNYQTLHVIDQVIEFAYVNRKTQLRSTQVNAGGASGSVSSSASTQYKKTTNVKRSLTLDDLSSSLQPEQQAAYEFYERFADLQANQPQVDLYHARVFKGTQQLQRIALSRDELNLERLVRSIRSQHPQLRGKLYQVNESSSLNTYFLPLNTEELDSLLDGPVSNSPLIYEAHIIPDQVLFTRTMSLGLAHPTLFDRNSNTHRVSLSLAKTLPDSTTSSDSSQSSPDSSSLQSASDNDDDITASRKFLATPLLVQCKCSAAAQASSAAAAATPSWLRTGITNAEILVANIPLSNGVLHLIKKPILVPETNVLDYLNDHNNQLSNVVNSAGSRTSGGQQQQQVAAISTTTNSPPLVKVNRFRELLARERQMLAIFSMDPTMNMTILAPSDEAFGKLRYDLRALVQGDETLIPKDWNPSYRHDLLERLVKRHVILHQLLTTDQFESPNPISSGQQAMSDNGKLLSFSALANSGEFQVESDSTQAHLIHHDLIGTNGVLHIIDNVLGEEQETVYSLLKSIVLKYNHSLEENNFNQNELGQLIQTNIRSRQQQQEVISSTQNSINADQTSSAATNEHHQNSKNNPELAIISKSIGQYLDELAGTANRLQLLASSVNISYQLARLTSLAEGLDDWNEKFKQPDRLFTYFVPSDLAWIRLQQAQPELYKPLMYFLEQQQQTSSEEQNNNVHDIGNNNSIYIESSSSTTSAGKSPRSSESSHRLRQILERHLVVNRKIAKSDLSQMDSLRTLGATLRLVEAQPQLTVSSTFGQESRFAALHSVATTTTTTGTHNHHQLAGKLTKTLRLDSSSANIVQANEASNGYVYVIDNVLLLPDDSEYIVQTSTGPAVSSTMSSLLGAHNSAILDLIHGLLSPSPLNMSAHSVLALIGTLTLAIAALLVVALVLLVRRRRQNKLNRHQQLESGLTSSSSASNSGSTSTTKSL